MIAVSAANATVSSTHVSAKRLHHVSSPGGATEMWEDRDVMRGIAFGVMVTQGLRSL